MKKDITKIRDLQVSDKKTAGLVVLGVIFVVLLLGWYMSIDTSREPIEQTTSRTQDSLAGYDIAVKAADDGLGDISPSLGLQGGSTDATLTENATALQNPQSPQVLQGTQSLQGSAPTSP